VPDEGYIRLKKLPICSNKVKTSWFSYENTWTKNRISFI
jgi:hypothetical protein